jgi:hypothetical protein
VRVWRIDARVLGALLVLTAWPAIAQVPAAFVADRIAGVRFDVMPPLVAHDGEHGSAEFSDVELFGVPGLRLSGARVLTRFGAVPAGIEIARLGAPVGSHARATVIAGVSSPRWRVGVRGGVELLALNGVPGESFTVAALVSVVDAGGATLLADVETIAGRGARVTFLNIAACGSVTGRSRMLASMRYDGPGALSLGIACALVLHRSLSVLAGWDDGTETARAGVLVKTGRLALTTAVFQHAVLGVSQGASLAVVW